MPFPKNRPQLRDLPDLPIGGDRRAARRRARRSCRRRAEDAAEAARSSAPTGSTAPSRSATADRAAAARRAEGKDTGTVRLDDGEVTVIADLPKKVEWDQAELATLVAAHPRRGRRPGRVRRHVFRVPERKYAAWPRHIRTAFERARTVKTGKPTFRLVLGEAR